MYSDPVQKEYSQIANRYDRRWSFYVNTTIQKTLDRLEIASKERILDLGCGTGTLIEHLLQMFPEAEVVGIDVSEEMLKVAKQKLSESVELKLGSADNLPFPNNSFDVIVSTSVFHYFRDPIRVLQEVKRVLKPYGRLVITDWCHDYLTCRIYDFFMRCFDRAHFHTYQVDEFQGMLQSEGFQEIVIEKYKIDWFWGMMTAKVVKSKSGD